MLIRLAASTLTSLASLGCGLLGSFTLFKFAVDLKALRDGEPWDMSSDGGGPYWSWPQDKGKIIPWAAGLLFASIGLLWLAVHLARKAIHAWPF
jgi:hypothetical protein